MVLSGNTSQVCLDVFFETEHFRTLNKVEELHGLYLMEPDAAQLAYISDIVSGVYVHLAELNDYIDKYSKGWRISRISEPALAVMRVAMYETLYYPEVPAAAAFNEAINIIRRYEGEATVKFVNGILGSYSREELAGL
jgi:N utilization substance protein B